MTFLIAAASPDLKAKIAKRFGHAPYYLIVDSESLNFTVINGARENEPSFDLSHFMNMGIDAFILGNIGPGAFNNLTKFGLPIYSCHGMIVTEAVKDVQSGKIQALLNPTMNRSVRTGSQGLGKNKMNQQGRSRGRRRN
ncbi:hypothetical protein K9N50_07225 [bacterium]|nr:hypothetical protein [bacterium]